MKKERKRSRRMLPVGLHLSYSFLRLFKWVGGNDASFLRVEVECLDVEQQ